MTDATGRTMTATEVAEWQALNADNESANGGGTTPSEYDTEKNLETTWRVSKTSRLNNA